MNLGLASEKATGEWQPGPQEQSQLTLLHLQRARTNVLHLMTALRALNDFRSAPRLKLPCLLRTE